MPLPTHAEIDQIFDNYIETIGNLERQFFDYLTNQTTKDPAEVDRLRGLFNANKNISRDPANTMRVLWKGFIPDIV